VLCGAPARGLVGQVFSLAYTVEAKVKFWPEIGIPLAEPGINSVVDFRLRVQYLVESTSSQSTHSSLGYLGPRVAGNPPASTLSPII
jgi:hypothetical protein